MRPWTLIPCLIGMTACARSAPPPAAPTSGRHPATRDECGTVVDLNVVAQLRTLGVTDPAIIEKRKADLRAAMAPDIDACVGRMISSKAIDCMKAAQRPEEIDRCVDE